MKLQKMTTYLGEEYRVEIDGEIDGGMFEGVVTVYDANEYITWLSRTTGSVYVNNYIDLCIKCVIRTLEPKIKYEEAMSQLDGWDGVIND